MKRFFSKSAHINLLLAATMTASLFWGALFVIKQVEKDLSNHDQSRAARSFEYLVEQELHILENRATRFAHNPKVFDAIETVDELDSINALNAFPFDKNATGIAMLDFEGDLLAESGLAPSPQYSKDVHSLIKAALKGEQASTISYIDNELALIAVVPVGFRESPAGVFIMADWLDNNYLSKFLNLIQNDLSLSFNAC